jgi:hypothetical protein
MRLVAQHRILRATAVTLTLACLPLPAFAEVDGAVTNRAAGISVTSGETVHKVADELPKLDALRTKILGGIATKIDNQDLNLSEDLKNLDKLDRYSSRLADLVSYTDPNAKDVIAWLQTNAAVAGTWREAYTSTGSYGDNSRLAELKALEKRIGRKLTGGIGKDIKGLRAIEDSAASSAALSELAKRVRLASDLVNKQPGIIKLTLKVRPAAVTAGQTVSTNVGLAMGGGGESIVGVQKTEQVILELAVTGPRSFSLGTLTKMYAPGEALATPTYFNIPTKDLPEGHYTASLSATDTHGHSLTAVDIFDVKPAKTVAVVAPAGGLSPQLIADIEKFAKSLGVKNLTAGHKEAMWIWGHVYENDNRVKESGYLAIDPEIKWQAWWENQRKESQTVNLNGTEAFLSKHKNEKRPVATPGARVMWVNKGRFCHVGVDMSQDWTEADNEKMAQRAIDIAKKFDAAINESEKAAR